jgi:hypothetical protein
MVKKQDFTRFFGVLSDERAEEIKATIKEQRARSRRRSARIIQNISQEYLN